jgi:Iron/manganese superoxide dismutases, alpha-hairpin domain
VETSDANGEDQNHLHPPQLPYRENALEPAISARTNSFHYGEHHRGYVKTLNKLVDDTSLPLTLPHSPGSPPTIRPDCQDRRWEQGGQETEAYKPSKADPFYRYQGH